MISAPIPEISPNVLKNPFKDLTTGIFEITNSVYHDSPGLSRSAITLLLKSPIYYWHKYINKATEEDKRHLKLGSALHTLVLEPNLFSEEYFLMDKCDRRTKEGKKYYEEALVSAGIKTLISMDDYNDLMDLKISIESNKNATDLLFNTEREKSIYWNNKRTNLLCKCRPDFMFLKSKDACYVGDIKTSTDASPRQFSRDMLSYGYHIQAAMIQEGIFEATGLLIEDFYYIVVEKDAPHVTAIYQLGKEALALGKLKFNEGLDIYTQCLKTGEFPGYEIQTIELPNYAYFN